MLRVRGYASVFGNIDAYGEVVDAGAFSRWISENPSKSVPLYWQHSYAFDWTAKPIGKTTMIRQDSYGLYFEGEIADTAEGLEIQELLKSGAITNASFGFKTIDQYQKDEVWHLSDLDLTEIAPVRWGANDSAYIEAIPEEETA